MIDTLDSACIEAGVFYGVGYSIRKVYLMPGRFHFCGYVNWNKPVAESIANELNVHGGVTYNDGDGCLGFDCAHALDTPERCNQDYVRAQCKKLIEELRAVDSLKEEK